MNSSSLSARIESLAPDRYAKAILQNATIELRAGEIACLLGPSGAGKTTILRFLAGDNNLESKASVRYRYGGMESMVEPVKACGGIGLFLPDGALPPWMTVAKLLRLPSRLNPRLQVPAEASTTRVLDQLRLPKSILARVPSELSLGMRHRVLLALGLLYHPPFYFVDEIFSTLDQPTASILLELLQAEVKASGSACLIATHDLERALKIGGRFYFKDLALGLIDVQEPNEESLLHLFENAYSESPGGTR